MTLCPSFTLTLGSVGSTLPGRIANILNGVAGAGHHVLKEAAAGEIGAKQGTGIARDGQLLV